MAYKHGTYGEMQATQDALSPSGVGTLPVYFGRLPIHQLMDYSGKVNTPILVQSFSDAQAKVGYSDNWEDYDLCEAIYAHFKNDIQVIGPIVLVNVLNPDVDKTTGKTASVVLANGQGYIDADNVILKSVEVADKVLGTDYTVQYTPDGSKVLFKDLTGEMTSPVSVTYDEVNPWAVIDNDIIGGTDPATGAKPAYPLWIWST